MLSSRGKLSGGVGTGWENKVSFRAASLSSKPLCSPSYVGRYITQLLGHRTESAHNYAPTPFTSHCWAGEGLTAIISVLPGTSSFPSTLADGEWGVYVAAGECDDRDMRNTSGPTRGPSVSLAHPGPLPIQGRNRWWSRSFSRGCSCSNIGNCSLPNSL